MSCLLGTIIKSGYRFYFEVEAFHLTEIVEHISKNVNPNLFLPQLLPYKIVYASLLADYGLLEESLKYGF